MNQPRITFIATLCKIYCPQRVSDGPGLSPDRMCLTAAVFEHSGHGGFSPRRRWKFRGDGSRLEVVHIMNLILGASTLQLIDSN